MPHTPGHVLPTTPTTTTTTAKTFMDKLADLFAETLRRRPVTQTDDMDAGMFNRMQDDYNQALRTLSSLINTNMFSEAGQNVMQGLQTQGQAMQALGNMAMPQMTPPAPPQTPQAPTMSPQSLANFGQRSTPPQQPQSYIPGM